MLILVHWLILQQMRVLNKGTFIILTVHVLPNQRFLSETRPMFSIRASEIFLCPGGETCWGLSILWLGSILETLDLAIVTPHTAHPPTLRERVWERESAVFGSDAQMGLTISRSAHKSEENWQCLTLNKSTRGTNAGFTFHGSAAHVLCNAFVGIGKLNSYFSSHLLRLTCPHVTFESVKWIKNWVEA